MNKEYRSFEIPKPLKKTIKVSDYNKVVKQRDKLAKGLCSLYNDVTDAEANHSYLTAKYMTTKINQILKSTRS